MRLHSAYVLAVGVALSMRAPPPWIEREVFPSDQDMSFVPQQHRRPEHAKIAFVTVVGSGEVRARPEAADLVVRASQKAPTPLEAKQKLDKQLDDFRFRVLGGNLKGSFNVYPSSYDVHKEFRYPRPEVAEVANYTASQRFSLDIHDLKVLDAILESVLNADDLCEVESIIMRVKEPLVYESQARALASQHAQEIAKDLADSFGYSLGRMMHVDASETSYYAKVGRRTSFADSAGAVGLYDGRTIDFSVTLKAVFEVIMPPREGMEIA